MKYIIKVDFNDKGIRLTGKDFYSKTIDINYKPNEEEIKKIVKEDVPEDLIKEITTIEGSFVNLEVGDYIKLNEYEIPTRSWQEPYLKSRIEKIKEIKDTLIFIENYNRSFNYDGTEHSKRKKYPSTISIPTLEEIKNHEYRLKHKKLVSEITELVTEDYKLSVLENDKLETILDILLEKDED